MATVGLQEIKALREKTGVSMQACKNALEEGKGDESTAVNILRKKGEVKALERGGRETGQGVVASYIHGNNKIGVIVQIACETDFVAKSPDFLSLGHDIAMHIAAMNPLYTSPEEVSHELIEKERDIWKAHLAKEGKPEAIWDKVIAGKEKKFREECALLTQAFVKDPDCTVQKLLSDAVLKLGENIRVVRFTRYSF